MVSRTDQARAVTLDAFRRFYTDASPHVYRYFVRATLGDRATSEDLTQETLTTIMLAAREGRADALTIPWMMGVARHKLVDHYRRVEREQRRLERSLMSPLRIVVDADDGDADDVIEALRRLAPEHRLVLVLKYYEELPVRDIADLIGRSVDATNSLLSRARAAYARIYEEPRR